MKSEKKKAKAKSAVRFKDLGSKKNPSGGSGMKWIEAMSPMKNARGWVE
jgi:hypothetical protein